MTGTFWDNRPHQQDEEDQELSPQEIAALTGTQMRPQRKAKVQEEYEYDVDAEVEEIQVRSNKPISQALLRLEQGKLYQMLIEHDLFSDVEANQQAIDSVQKEMKDFITSRLEVLLGMRQDGDFSRSIEKVESPFTDIEVEALKSLAKKLTGGLAQKIEDQPKTGSFTPVGNADKAKSMLNKMAPKKVEQVRKIQKTVVPKQQKPYKAPEKNYEDITEEDLIARNAAIKNKKAYPEGIKPLPQLTADQQRAHYESQNNSSPKTINLVNAVLMARSKGV